MIDSELPLLPLVTDGVPPGLLQTLAQAGVPFRQRTSGGEEGRFVLFDSRSSLAPSPGYGQIAIDIDRFRNPDEPDPFELLLNEESQLQQWDIAGWTVAEEVARVDRRTLRQRILDWLRDEIEQAGGIWLCVSPFPFPYRSAFNLRIDHPQFDAINFHAALRALDDCLPVTTHFLSGETFESHPDDLIRLRGLDVGSQGYCCEVFSTEQENLENVRKGIESLRAAGLDPVGYAAPAGRFSRSLLHALEELEIGYSSELCLAYDDLPFFPEGSLVLQVPVHPISLNSFPGMMHPGESKSPADVQQAVRAGVDYFRDLARRKYHAGEPVFFRGQSTGDFLCYPQLLRAVLDTADSFGAIWKTTLRQFADWWRARASVRIRVTREEDHYRVKSDGHPPEYHVGIEYWRGRHVARIRLKGHELQFSPLALAYENRSAPPLVHPVRVDPPEGLRGFVRRWVESGKDSVVDESSPDSWRDWAKRALRHLRG